MGTFRVTQGLLVQRALFNLSRQASSVLKMQDQLATGRRVTTPSDNPIDARRAINTQTLMSQNDQYIANISSAGPLLTESSSTIETLQEVLNRAYELTLQASNGTYAQGQLDSIAEEINQLIEGALTNGNHETNGRYIFGGTRTLSPPFVATRDANGDITVVTYQGNTEQYGVAVSDGSWVPVNEPGQRVFQSSQDIFQTLISIRDNILAGDQTSLQNQRLSELETARQQLGQSMARVGAIQNRFDRTSSDIEDFNLQLRELLSDTVDADFAEVVVNLNAQQNAYQAALAAAARVIQPSLLDFLG